LSLGVQVQPGQQNEILSQKEEGRKKKEKEEEEKKEEEEEEKKKERRRRRRRRRGRNSQTKSYHSALQLKFFQYLNFFQYNIKFAIVSSFKYRV
jgi:hypothetical protein